MRTFLPSLLSSLVAAAVATIAPAADVQRYDLDLRLDPEGGRLAASAGLVIGLEPGQREVRLLLNRGLRITSLEAEPPLAGFHLRHDQREILRYAPEATPLDLALGAPATEAGTLVLRLEYEGSIAPDAWGVNLVTPEWVELGMYSGWFPLDPEQGSFDAAVTVRQPEGWDAVGTGGLRSDGDGLWSGAATDVDDVVVIAAPALAVRSAGPGLRVLGPGTDTARLEEMAAAAASILERLEEVLGPAPGAGLDIVLSARTRGGGYVRPGLAVLQDDGGDLAEPGWTRYLAHEISHLWWFRAPATSWEDWVNESFAETAALLLVGERHGAATLAGLRKRYREQAAAAPAIHGIDRSHEQAYAALYRAGPLLLLELEERVGPEAFRRFLRELVASRVASTREVLAVLSRVTSPETADWLNAALREPVAPPPPEDGRAATPE